MSETTPTPQPLDLVAEARSETCAKRYTAQEAKSLALGLAAEVEALRAERDDLDHQLAQHVIALRDMRHERDTYKRALEGKP